MKTCNDTENANKKLSDLISAGSVGVLYSRDNIRQSDKNAGKEDNKDPNTSLEVVLQKLEHALSSTFDKFDAGELKLAQERFPELFGAYVTSRIRRDGREFTQYLAEKLGIKFQTYDRD